MAVCNLFSPLNKVTGTFITFSQYAEDLSKLIGEQPSWNVVPAKFYALNVDYSAWDNESLMQLFQNNFENMLAITKKKENWSNIAELGGWSSQWEFFSSEFWKMMTASNLLRTDGANVVYGADINLTSSDIQADGMHYSEAFCYIPNDASKMTFALSYGDSRTSLNFTAGETPEGWNTVPATCVPYVSPGSYDTTNVVCSLDEGVSTPTPEDFEFNTIIVLYNVYAYDQVEKTWQEAGTNIPMGIYFTGVIDNGEMTNTITKFVPGSAASSDIFENGTSYGLRVCIRVAISPTQDQVQSISIVSNAEDYTTYSSVMSAFARTISKIDEVLSKVNANSNQMKEWIQFWRTQKVNVPYVEEVDGVAWWFVNGQKIIEVNAGSDSSGNGSEAYEASDIDITSYDLKNYYIKDDGTYNTNSDYKHIIVPAAPGQSYKITAQEDKNATYAFVNSTTATAGGSAHYVPGTSKVRIVAGETETIKVPDGTTYIYFYAGNTASGTGREYLPTLEKIVSMTRVVPVYNSLTSVATIQQDGEPATSIVPPMTARPYLYFIGAAGTFKSGAAVNSMMLGVTPGHTYRVYIDNVNVGMSEVEAAISSGYRFETIFKKSDDTTDIQNRVAYNRALKPYYDTTAPDGAVALYIGGRCNTGIEFGAWVEDLGDSSLKTSILELNPDSEFRPKMQAINKQYYSSSYKNVPKPLVIAHISDIHGNWENVRRFIEFCDHYDSLYDNMIDERIQTGDLVRQYFTYDISGYTSIAGSEKIIGVIGNHDTYQKNGSWTEYVGVEAYNKFIAPFVSNWNVVQPSNAATEGKCYFYKDYVDQAIRIIFTDGMGWDSAQNTWLASVLDDARTNEYDVMIATHFAGSNPAATKDDPAFDVPTANWQTTYTTGTTASTLYTYNHDTYQMMDRVQEFIDAGGIFIGYLQGHYHKDFVAKVHRYPAQMMYSIGGSLIETVGDYDHEAGTRMQDEFEILGIDTFSKVVKIIKVGANVDRFGAVKNSIAIKYDTATILRES